jgi:hypothetical protein
VTTGLTICLSPFATNAIIPLLWRLPALKPCSPAAIQRLVVRVRSLTHLETNPARKPPPMRLITRILKMPAISSSLDGNLLPRGSTRGPAGRYTMRDAAGDRRARRRHSGAFLTLPGTPRLPRCRVRQSKTTCRKGTLTAMTRETVTPTLIPPAPEHYGGEHVVFSPPSSSTAARGRCQSPDTAPPSYRPPLLSRPGS